MLRDDRIWQSIPVTLPVWSKGSDVPPSPGCWGWAFWGVWVAPLYYRARRPPGESTPVIGRLPAAPEPAAQCWVKKNETINEEDMIWQKTNSNFKGGMRTDCNFTHSSKILFISRVKNFFLPSWSNCLDAWVKMNTKNQVTQENSITART